MNITVRTLIGLGLAVAMYVIGSLVQSASVFGLSPVAVEILKIGSGVLALVANMLPSVFKSENYIRPS